MVEINREQIIKALEIHTGILDMPCEECPYNCDAHDEICLDFLTKDALALINSQEQRIGELAEEVEDLKVTLLARTMALTTLKAVKKELTEENERLTRLANLRQRDLDNANDLLFKAEDEIERLMREKTALECIVSTARNQAKADTVRKMRERLKQYIDVGHYRSPTEICFSELDVANIIDQITKEMLEGDNEN